MEISLSPGLSVKAASEPLLALPSEGAGTDSDFQVKKAHTHPQYWKSVTGDRHRNELAGRNAKRS